MNDGPDAPLTTRLNSRKYLHIKYCFQLSSVVVTQCKFRWMQGLMVTSSMVVGS